MSQNEPIVFVDDDVDDQFIYREICERLGVANELIFFKKASDLLDYLRETADKPIIIICDINMPEMDGLELRRSLNDEEQLRRKSIPFVFFSTAYTREQIIEAYDLTVQGYFIKEQNFADTEATFKMILDYWTKCKHPNSVK